MLRIWCYNLHTMKTDLKCLARIYFGGNIQKLEIDFFSPSMADNKIPGTLLVTIISNGWL